MDPLTQILLKSRAKRLTEKLTDTQLVHIIFESDGYGQFRTSYSNTETIKLFADKRFIKHCAIITQTGFYGSNLRESKNFGEWSIIPPTIISEVMRVLLS